MADDKTSRSKLSEKDHKDTEDEDVHANISGPNAEDTSKEKSKATTQAQKTEEEEEATKKKLQIGVGDHTKGLEREAKQSVHGKEIAGSSGVEMPTKTDDEKFESVKAEAESFSAGEHVSSDLSKSDDSNRSVEEFTRKVHAGSSPSVISKHESDTSGDAGAVTPDLIGGVSSAENEGELKQSESGSGIYLDAHTTFKELEKKSGFDLEIDTNMEGLEEELYEVAQRNRKGKAKLEEEGKELDDDPEVESNIEVLVKEIRELYRQVTKGTKGKLERLMKNGEEYTSEDEESESESESESELYRKCEMLLKTPLRLMLKLDTEIRGLVEELEELITSKDDKAGPKLRALRAELEALKESNYQKEVEVIGMVKGLIDDGVEENSVIDAVVYSGVGPMVEEAKERIARVRSEIEEVDDDEKSGFDLEIDTNMEGLEEEIYEVAQLARKGKGKLEEEGKELDDDPEVESNIEGPVRAMRELYRQVTKGTEGKLERLKNREEYTSEDEESESESESELYRKCEMLLKTPLHPMLELDTEIRGLREKLEELITSKDVKAGRKLPALRAELEALKESNYQKEVEVIGMVKGLIIDDGAEEKSVIDAVVYSGVGPMVEEAKERIARVRLEIEEVEMDRNKSFGCCGGLNVDFLRNWK